jgi:putative aldouronate transport system permease protein
MDGANRWQRMMKITLPSIMPTVIVMLILRMGSIISVDFEQTFLMNNALVKSKLEVFEIFIYNNSIATGSTQYSYTTAIGMFKSVVNTILVCLTNWISNRKGYDGVL